MISSDFYDEVIFHLSGTLIDVEMELEDVDKAFKYAVQQYKQKGSDNFDRVFVPLVVEKGKNTYDLNDPKINTVNSLIRLKTSSGIYANEPFSQSIVQDYFTHSSTGGGFYMLYELTMNMIENSKLYTAEEPNFQYIRNQNKLILRNPPKHTDSEEWLMDVYLSLDDSAYENILWIKDYTIAHCKQVLGRAYRQFGSIPSPTGDTQTDGNDLVNEAQQEKEALLEQIDQFVDGEATGLGVFIG